MWCAVKLNHLVVKLPPERNGVDVNAKTGRGETLLWWSASNGDFAMMELLLQRHDKVNVYEWKKQWPNPLMTEAQDGQLLLSLDDVKTNMPGDETGRTVLTFAAHNGHQAVVQLLLERDNAGADRALAFAAGSWHEVAVWLLLEWNDVGPEFSESVNVCDRA
jgi:ankyrin repeat protein